MFNYEVALNYWEVFLLILVRIASFVYTAPFFNMANTPQRTKLGLAFFISLIVFTLVPDRTLEYSSILEYAILVIKESVVGLLLGFSCMVCVQTITLRVTLLTVILVCQWQASMTLPLETRLQYQVRYITIRYFYSLWYRDFISSLYQRLWIHILLSL